jgi:hypothetical protein
LWPAPANASCPRATNVQATVAVEVRHRNIVKTLPVYLLDRPVSTAATPEPNESVIHQANDIVTTVLIDVRNFESGTEGAFGCNHVPLSTWTLVPDQSTTGVSANHQVRPTVSIDIANSLSPRGKRADLIHFYVVECYGAGHWSATLTSAEDD